MFKNDKRMETLKKFNKEIKEDNFDFEERLFNTTVERSKRDTFETQDGDDIQDTQESEMEQIEDVDNTEKRRFFREMKVANENFK